MQLESHFNSVPSPSTQPDVHIRKNVTTLQVDAVGSDLNGVESCSIQAFRLCCDLGHIGIFVLKTVALWR